MSLKTVAPNYQSRLASIMRNVGSGDRVLNLGCGDGYFNVFLAKRFKRVYSVDVNAVDIENAKSHYPGDNIEYGVASAMDLPFPDRFFDRIVCSDVLEHIRDHTGAIKEIARTLKPDGIAIITVPSHDYPFTCDPINWISERICGRHLPIGIWGFGHIRLYTMGQLEGLFAKEGLHPLKRMYLLHFLNCIFENYYLINLLQPLTKSDPKNTDALGKETIGASKERGPPTVSYSRPPKVLCAIRDTIMRADHALFGRSKKSVGIFLMLRKTRKKAMVQTDRAIKKI